MFLTEGSNVSIRAESERTKRIGETRSPTHRLGADGASLLPEFSTSGLLKSEEEEQERVAKEQAQQLEMLNMENANLDQDIEHLKRRILAVLLPLIGFAVIITSQLT